MSVPQSHANATTASRPAALPAASAMLAKIVDELSDYGADEHLTAQLADLISLKGKTNARSTAGGIVCG
jgi:hypothetical protein